MARKSQTNQQTKGGPSPAGLVSFLGGHRDTAGDSLLRLLRAPAATLMTVLVIAIALLLPGFLGQLESNLDPVAENFQDSARITLFLQADISEQGGQQLSEDLLENTRYSAVEYLSSAAALAEFRLNSGFDGIIDDLEGNPLPASITLIPGVQAPSEIEALATELENLPEVESIRVDLAWIQRLSAVIDLVARLRILLASILSLAVVLIVGNTIRMAIENRAREIEVVKLVGGTDSFIARPFLYSGLLLGASGGLLAGLMLLGLQLLIAEPIDTLLSLYGAELTIQPPGAAELISSTVIGALLGWAGAIVSVTLRLRSMPA